MITIRKATLDDAIRLYVWRTHPSTRAMMRESGEIRWEDHLQWLRSVLEDPNRYLYIALREGAAVGSVRFDVVQDTATAEVSVTVAPECRGAGVGVEILRLGTAAIRKHTHRVEARIKTENIASQKAFAKAGYTLVSQSENEVVMVAQR